MIIYCLKCIQKLNNLYSKGYLIERSNGKNLTGMNKSNSMFTECFHMYEESKYIYDI